MRVFFSERVELLRLLNESIFFFFLERVELLRSLNEGIFSERFEILRLLSESIFFWSGLSYSDHSMKVFFGAD